MEKPTNRCTGNDRLVGGVSIVHASPLDRAVTSETVCSTATVQSSNKPDTSASERGHSKDPSTKHGLIKKILRRNFNQDSRNRVKIVEVRSHQLNHNTSGALATSSARQDMGNVHQANPALERIRPTHLSNIARGNSDPSTTTPQRSGSYIGMERSAMPGSSSLVSSLTTTTTTTTVTSIGSAVPNGDTLKTLSSDATEQVPQLQALVERLKSTVRARDRRIYDLEREVDKLRSVLDQQITDTWVSSTSSTKNNATALQTITLNRPDQSFVSEHAIPVSTPEEVTHPSSLSESGSSVEMLSVCASPAPGSTPPAAALLLRKRLGVSGEPTRKAEELKYYEKDAKSRQQIREALRSNELLMNLDVVQLQEMVSCMHEQHVPANCYIIREGDDGQHLYVGAEGEYDVSKGGRRLCIMPAGRCFGELALLYNCKRTASVKALVNSRLWVLERGCFQAIMKKTGLERIEERKAFLRSVSLLKDVPSERILRIADALEAQYHSPGDCIIRQGELADSFFIIQSGVVNVTISTTRETGETVEQDIRQMSRGEYFGEKALLGEGRRTANVYAQGPDGVEVLCLYRKDFLELIGGMQELMNKPYMEGETVGTPEKCRKVPPPLKLTSPDRMSDEAKMMKLPESPSPSLTGAFHLPRLFHLDHNKTPVTPSIRLADLERICVLGVGGFGRVDLVTLSYDRTQAFAMKRMQKQHIVQTRQQEHVHFEKLILSSVNSPFICRLYATYHDNKYVYMLLEACLGGELWTVLRDSHHLDDRSAKFCLACCIEALDYLHRHGIIYRDLKPENMLITSRGYIKMCDFGFAKFIGVGNKTWTFCGTPEYVAPEVILNKGHDFAADYWSLGILTFELLTGAPPFQASEPIKIYMKTLKGIDALGLAQNKYISLKALHFIRRLCRFNPSERLGVGKHGIQEIRSHKYFQGFDWAGISKQTMPTPFKVKLNGPLDHSNFDRFTMDEQEPPDETSGWDANF